MEGLTAKPNVKVDELMERDIVTVNAHDDREEVADKVERYDLLAIPVVDDEYRLVGIITHDDVIDVLGIIIYMNVAWWMFLYPALPTPVP